MVVTLEDIKEFSCQGRPHDTDKLGSWRNQQHLEAVLYCRNGTIPYLGSTCNETSVHESLYKSPWPQATSDSLKPGMGVDEGLSICTNEMNRTLALLKENRVGINIEVIQYEDIVAQVKELCLDVTATCLRMCGTLVKAQVRHPLVERPEYYFGKSRMPRKENASLPGYWYGRGLYRGGPGYAYPGWTLQDAVDEVSGRPMRKGTSAKVLWEILERVNTRTTPAVLHVSLTAGGELHFIVARRASAAKTCLP